MNNWKKICKLTDIPALGARVVRLGKNMHREDDIAIFRTASDEVFALRDRCPHKGGPLSQGIVAGQQVTCPLHSWNIDLKSGESLAPDKGCTQLREVKIDNGDVWLRV